MCSIYVCFLPLTTSLELCLSVEGMFNAHTTVHAVPEGGILLKGGIELKQLLSFHSWLSSQGKS